MSPQAMRYPMIAQHRAAAAIFVAYQFHSYVSFSTRGLHA
jgi:hypothetical protein